MSISNDLRRAFERASLNREAKSILTARQWKTFQDITRVHDEQIQQEKRRYEDEFETRVEMARRRIINEAGRKNKDFKPRMLSRDALNKDDVNRQAVRDVQHAHHRRIAAIEQKQVEDISRFIERCEIARETSQRFKQDFSRASNRRSGDDRRKDTAPSQSRPRPKQARTLRREP